MSRSALPASIHICIQGVAAAEAALLPAEHLDAPAPFPDGISRSRAGEEAFVRFSCVSIRDVGVCVKGSLEHAAAVATTMDQTGAGAFNAAPLP